MQESVNLRGWLALHKIRLPQDIVASLDAKYAELDFDDDALPPTPADKAASWELFSEIRTRITTQPLEHRAGDEKTALESVAQLFQLTREIIKNRECDCRFFADIAAAMLNGPIRPFTARWHRRSIDGAFRSEDSRHEFRHQLHDLREELREFVRMLEAMAVGSTSPREGVRRAEHQFDGRVAEWLSLDRLRGPEDSDTGPLVAAEKKAIRARRSEDRDPTTGFGTTGLALSGGGIRSATFCLGFAEALARRKLLEPFDYLSTVSGGGYFGAFLSDAFRSARNETRSFEEVLRADSDEVQRLRNRAKYLLGPNTAKSIATAIATMVSGWVVNLSPILLFLGLALGLRWFLWLWRGQEGEQLVISWFWWITGLSVPILAFATALPFRRRAQTHLRVALAFVVAVTIVVLALYLGSWFCRDLLLQREWYHGLLVSVTTAVAGGFVARWMRWRWALFWILQFIAVVLVPLALLLAFVVLSDRYVLGEPSTTDWLVAASVVFVALVVALSANINRTGPHRFYRDSLCATFLRDGADTKCRLRDLGGPGSRAPYHLINTTVNLPGSQLESLRGRRSDFFIFSKEYCGSATTGFAETAKFERLDSEVDLGTAMAISGAAASSHMGRMPFRRLVALLTVLNVRLGYWIPHPKNAPRRPPSTWYLLCEMLSWLDERKSYLNLSDGGHIENLGLYELLRRRCRFIVVVDAEADGNVSCASLMRCMRYAEVDLRTRIHVDLSDLKRRDDGTTDAHFVLGLIEYLPTDGQPQSLYGYVLYVKSSMTGDEPPTVKDYASSNNSFPHESTADQFFDEDQFEAYRALGEHIGNRVFREQIVKGPALESLQLWLDGLRDALFDPYDGPEAVANR